MKHAMMKNLGLALLYYQIKKQFEVIKIILIQDKVLPWNNKWVEKQNQGLHWYWAFHGVIVSWNENLREFSVV